ncbi:cupin domain-containing protein [Pararhodobacter oceanensis]|uniref:cupin domain-containing protein n=1 Tax=Pararhodobacter oceanensis TaxID=2172121 RepID=UPI003A92A720
MSDCEIYQTDMAETPFSVTGNELSVDMRWVSDPIDAHKSGEELVAVIEGAGRLTCDGEVYALSKGQGVLIPDASERAWEFEAPALLYRVALK